MPSRRTAMYGCCCGVGILAILMTATVIANSIRPSYAVRIADGIAGATPWKVWAYGLNHKRRCIATFTIYGAFAHEDEVCESALAPPPSWSLVLRRRVGGGTADTSQTLVVFVTALNVARLRLTVSCDRQKHVWIQSHGISSSAARKAGLRGDIAYAVGTIPSSGCLSDVMAVSKRDRSVMLVPSS